MAKIIHYTVSAATTAFAAWHYSTQISNGYKLVKSMTKNFAKYELTLTEAARVMNFMSSDPQIKKITSAWIEMEEKGGLQIALQNAKQATVTKCAASAEIDIEHTKKTIACLKTAMNSDSDTISKVSEAVQCYSPAEASTADEVIAFGNCIVDDFHAFLS